MKAGDVHRHDFQADIYETPFRLLEDLGGGRWLCERMEPDERSLERYAEVQGSKYIDPMADLDRALAEVGETFEIRFVSREVWAAAF